MLLLLAFPNPLTPNLAILLAKQLNSNHFSQCTSICHPHFTCATTTSLLTLLENCCADLSGFPALELELEANLHVILGIVSCTNASSPRSIIGFGRVNDVLDWINNYTDQVLTRDVPLTVFLNGAGALAQYFVLALKGLKYYHKNTFKAIHILLIFVPSTLLVSTMW